MPWLVLVPAILALWVGRKKGVEAAFLNVYLPTLFLLPNSFRWVLPGLPDPAFIHPVTLVIAGFLFTDRRFHWKWSFLDLPVALFFFTSCISEYANCGWPDTQNVAFDLIVLGILPYVFTKSLNIPLDLSSRFARRVVVLLACAAAEMVWEARMGQNIFLILGRSVFPGQMGFTPNDFRSGFYRASGPFGHSILAGAIFVSGIFLQRWLVRRRKLPGFRDSLTPSSRSRVLQGALLLGSICTISRAPWIGGALGFAVCWIGTTRNPKRALVIAGIGIVLGALVATSYVAKYTSVSRLEIADKDQENAVYRRELLDRYWDLAKNGGLWGWSITRRPVVPGMFSIDNHFLLVMLEEGSIGVTLFSLVLISVMARLLLTALSAATPDLQALQFTLLGCLLAMFISLTTVFLGEQLYMVLYLIVGWSEGTVAFRKTIQVRTAPVAAAALMPFRFRRVLV